MMERCSVSVCVCVSFGCLLSACMKESELHGRAPTVYMYTMKIINILDTRNHGRRHSRNGDG